MDGDFQVKFVEMKNEGERLKKVVNELEITFQFAKKLLDLNAEVSFIGGAEFVSTQASERVHSIEKAVSSLMENTRLHEYELTKAKTTHIGKGLKSETMTLSEKTSPPGDATQKTSIAVTNEDDDDSNFETMSSRED